MNERVKEPATPATSRGPTMPGRFWRELAESFRHPDFWALSSWLGIIVRARKSRLGVAWLFAQSIVYVFGLGMFFANSRFSGPVTATLGEYLAHVALGMMVFRTVMSTVTGSAGIFNGNQAFIMDGHMRLTDYLLQALAKAAFDMCMYLPVVAATLWMAGGVAPLGLLTTLPVLFIIYLNLLWIAALFSVVGARFPDLGNLMSTVSIFAFIMTPIIWYADMIPADSVRGTVMRINPLYHLIEIFRAPILGETINPVSLWYVGVMTFVGLVAGSFAYRRYARYVPLWI